MDAVTKVKMLMPRQTQPGSNRDAGSNSLSGIISTLVPVLIISCVYLAIFLLLRTKIQRVYEPRSLKNLVPQHHQAERARGTLFGWIPAMRAVKDSDILRTHSLDAYLYLRFLKMLAFISFVGACVTWPILFPVNATGGRDQQQLDKLSFSNVANPNRYYAHALVAWIFQGFVAYVITRERNFYVGLKQAYSLSTLHALRLSSRTVMFLNVPDSQLKDNSIRRTFPSARKIWMAPDCKDLEDLVEDRDKEWKRLEKTQVKMIRAVRKRSMKGNYNEERPFEGIKAPTHRTKFLVGKKVETLPHSRAEMARLNQEIERTQNSLLDEQGKMLSAVFIEFENQLEAQKAIQFAVRESRTAWTPRQIGVQPDEVIWKNLGTSYKSRKSKMLGASIIVTLMCLFWTIPVAFVGVLSNVNYLTTQVPFLSFINDIPDVILGVVTGLLPTILLAVLMALVPIFLRLLAKFAGAATLSETELKVQSWYFAFQVIQVFLVTTFTSGAAAVAAQIVTAPQSAITLLAENLPTASNFYISYFILYGLNMAMSQLLNLVPFLLFYVLAFLDKTPRSKFNRWMSLKGLPWGSYYPIITNLGVIALAYSCIAPLVLGFSTIGFTLLYLGFRYNFLFVYGLQADTNGEAYIKAMKQLYTGIYLSTLCLIGLFAIRTSDSRASVGPMVLMIIFLIALVIFQVITDRAYSPMEKSLPIWRLESNPSSNIPAQRVEDLEKGADESNEKTTIDRAGEQDHRASASTSAVVTTGGPTQNKTGNGFTRYVNPFIAEAFEKNRKLIATWERDFEDNEHYTAEDLDVAYQNPALAAETRPVIWLPRDQKGISTRLIRENKEAGLESTDEHAWLNAKGKVEWSHDNLIECPAYEEKKLW